MNLIMDQKKNDRIFYSILINSGIANITNMTVWFAIIFFAYLETQAVMATAIISGLYLVSVATTGFWFGNLVDHYKKKNLMIISTILSAIAYALCFVVYLLAPAGEFKSLSSPYLWILAVLVLAGVVAGNIRGVALPPLVTVLIPEDRRDKANGLVGTVFGIAFFVVSVFSGLLVGHSGMYLVLIIALIISVISLLHLLTIEIPEHKVIHTDGEDDPSTKGKLDIKGTIKIIKSVPGLITLIFFTTFNNFLGGVFMSLMDAYGLSLVSVEVWGILWGVLSTAFIVGGIIIARVGLGKNPLKSLFLANITIWVISIIFTVQPSIVLLMIGMYIYLAVAPFIEASEHTIIQKVVPVERQGRVFGFAQSVEQAASPITSFLIGPITQFIFIPFMTEGGKGAELIGSWFGVSANRGMALVFIITGIIGLIVTLLATRSQFYKNLSQQYINK